jgi:hypothetical protein
MLLEVWHDESEISLAVRDRSTQSSHHPGNSFQLRFFNIKMDLNRKLKKLFLLKTFMGTLRWSQKNERNGQIDED